MLSGFRQLEQRSALQLNVWQLSGFIYLLTVFNPQHKRHQWQGTVISPFLGLREPLDIHGNHPGLGEEQGLIFPLHFQNLFSPKLLSLAAARLYHINAEQETGQGKFLRGALSGSSWRQHFGWIIWKGQTRRDVIGWEGWQRQQPKQRAEETQWWHWIVVCGQRKDIHSWGSVWMSTAKRECILSIMSAPTGISVSGVGRTLLIKVPVCTCGEWRVPAHYWF